MRFDHRCDTGFLQQLGALLVELVALLVAWIGGGRHRDHREVGHRNLHWSDHGCAVRPFGPLAADADLACAFRLDLHGELCGRGGELRIQRGDLPFEVVELLNRFGLDPDLHKLGVRFTKRLGYLLDGLELLREFILALGAKRSCDQFLKLLLAPGESLQRFLEDRDLLVCAGDRAALILLASDKIRELSGKRGFGFAVGIDAGREVAVLREALGRAFDDATGGRGFRLALSHLLFGGARIGQGVAGIGELSREFLVSHRIG